MMLNRLAAKGTFFVRLFLSLCLCMLQGTSAIPQVMPCTAERSCSCKLQDATDLSKSCFLTRERRSCCARSYYTDVTSKSAALTTN